MSKELGLPYGATGQIIAQALKAAWDICGNTCNLSCLTYSRRFSLQHQINMPTVTDPESLPSDVKLILDMTENIPEEIKKRAQKKIKDIITTEDIPLDYRAVTQYTPEEIIAVNILPNPWFKTRGALNDDDVKLHACIIAYASDSGFISTSAAANGFTKNGPCTNEERSMVFMVEMEP
ncbi:uncharacterized protein BX663DRAFT_482400 [Cokeromyces recurvatus]|uniref:uncharacterized protein n=1 Tax=Cokeromyces recurvatus TaxID=90255 RepID=UPI00221F2E97|nr:uncharacterized protein BX663DRAFT_482400 [Cokeromyces recurvatus]KAI7908190.1 hypothetical protein BX663DRAFT_482400 [Cokeromyces recurvatus]